MAWLLLWHHHRAHHRRGRRPQWYSWTWAVLWLALAAGCAAAGWAYLPAAVVALLAALWMAVR